MTNYVLSTNQESKSANDASIGKQLIYVPIYSGHAKMNVGYKKWIFSYRHNYTGYRYISTDHSQYLLPYYLGSAYISYKIELRNAIANFFVQANNIWNTRYQVVATRAMPQQNYNIGISFEFNKPNKY